MQGSFDRFLENYFPFLKPTPKPKLEWTQERFERMMQRIENRKKSKYIST